MNPDYFLGGDIQLDPELAEREVRRQIAEPLGMETAAAAAGVIELFEQTLRHEAVGRILGKGYSPADYTLLCYGGGGPLHVAGYTAGVTYRDVLVPAWAAGFSAYGCACADFEYRYDQTVDMPLLPIFDEAAKAGIGGMISGAWRGARGARRRRVREVRHRARGDQLHADRRGCSTTASSTTSRSSRRTPRSTARRAVDELIAEFEDAYGEGLRELGPLARARLPGHAGRRARHAPTVEKPVAARAARAARARRR